MNSILVLCICAILCGAIAYPQRLEENPSDYQLVLAVQNGDVSEVESLLKNGINPNIKDAFGRAPLQIAVSRGYFEIAELLINHSADANVEDSKGNSVLISASSKDNDQIIELLIKSGADKNHSNKNGMTALHAAALFEHEKNVESLIKNGADVNALDKDHATPLYHAVAADSKSRKTAKIAEILINNGANPNISINAGLSPLIVAVLFENEAAAELLLRHGVDVDRPFKDGLTLLHGVADKGLPKFAELLINHKANVNAVEPEKLATPLHLAANGDTDEHYAITGLLINAGANINPVAFDNLTPLDLARDDRIANLLREHGGRKNKS